MKHDILIIGGGASGIVAAIHGKDLGCDCAIIEGEDRIGKKILTTGNGRCNISNKNISLDRYHSSNTLFFKDTLESFNLKDTIDFFYSLGLPITTLDGGKMYPLSLQASSVIDILRLAIDDRNIPIYLNNKVKSIKSSNKGFVVETNNHMFTCKKILLCTGGKSMAKTGSDGSGYNLAKNLGHRIINPVPALVQLKLESKHLKSLSGIKFNGEAEIIVNNKSIRKEEGEILFTNYGISGPPILQLSRIASVNLCNNSSTFIKINMFPNKTKEELSDFLDNHFGLFSYRSVCDALIGVINKKLIPTILKICGLTDIHMPCYNIDWKFKQNLLNILQNWQFKVIDTNSFSNSQVTCGGIDTAKVNPKTLESTLVKGLYFSGEILDVDGDCGGFNLQWAWSSGINAINNIANSL